MLRGAVESFMLRDMRDLEPGALLEGGKIANNSAHGPRALFTEIVAGVCQNRQYSVGKRGQMTQPRSTREVDRSISKP